MMSTFIIVSLSILFTGVIYYAVREITTLQV
jgi:cbb3-type cytochrome oxidase subunit 3